MIALEDSGRVERSEPDQRRDDGETGEKEERHCAPRDVLGVHLAAAQVDVVERDGKLLISADLPGVKKEDVKIAVADGVLTISGERKMEREEQNENTIRVESIYGAFTRSFVLPDSVDDKGIKAEAKDGVLRIHIPKTESKKAQPLAIEVH